MGRHHAALDAASRSAVVPPTALPDEEWSRLGALLKPQGVPVEIRPAIEAACDDYLNGRQFETSTATVQDARRRLDEMREQAKVFEVLALRCYDHGTDEASSVTRAIEKAMAGRRVQIGPDDLQLGHGLPTAWQSLPDMTGPALAIGLSSTIMLDMAREVRAALAQAAEHFDRLEAERFGFEPGNALAAWLLAVRGLFEEWNKANPHAKSYGVGGLSGGSKPTAFAVFLHALNRTLPTDLANHVQSPAAMGERLKDAVARTRQNGGSIDGDSADESNPLP